MAVSLLLRPMAHVSAMLALDAKSKKDKEKEAGKDTNKQATAAASADLNGSGSVKRDVLSEVGMATAVLQRLGIISGSWVRFLRFFSD